VVSYAAIVMLRAALSGRRQGQVEAAAAGVMG
jgi:hypothetical protein